jgi:hypothetical protein
MFSVTFFKGISKADDISVGSFFDRMRGVCKDAKVRFITKPAPIYLAEADVLIAIAKTDKEECGCLKIHMPKARSRTMVNVLKIEAKRHNKRKGSEAYHKRIQKKWDKRVLKEGSDCKLAVQIPVQLTTLNNL